ncbi:Serine Threonine Kinase [Oopsacas minuta]|uniref:Serine Threonine Kinase n=1 Tax=Oopsacas minuta TaxID=111878 RepID=A0AAV7KK57_9METZ|nr:Serine Threonine Kinase [Oopsacas minuta]
MMKRNGMFILATEAKLFTYSNSMVHKAQSKLDPQVFSAAKVIELADNSELNAFLIEINILADCDHHYILKLYEAYFFDNKLWYFLEFCPGGALDDIIIELDHGFSELQIVCVTKQLIEALSYLHSRRIIHRDVKAGNMLLCSQGTIRLADFGVSCINKRTISKRDTFIGTPYWMAPEIFNFVIKRHVEKQPELNRDMHTKIAFFFDKKPGGL